MSDLADSHSQSFLDMLTVALHFVKVSLSDSKNTNQTKENNAFKSCSVRNLTVRKFLLKFLRTTS